MITLRRVYDPEKTCESYKVLVDRLWSVEISKEEKYNNAAALREFLM